MSLNSNNEDLKWELTKVHFGVIGAVMLFVLALVAQNVQYRDLNNELVALDNEKNLLKEETLRLNIQKAQMSDPIRIRNIASEKLGMVGVDADRIHDIKVEGK